MTKLKQKLKQLGYQYDYVRDYPNDEPAGYYVKYYESYFEFVDIEIILEVDDGEIDFDCCYVYVNEQRVETSDDAERLCYWIKEAQNQLQKDLEVLKQCQN